MEQPYPIPIITEQALPRLALLHLAGKSLFLLVLSEGFLWARLPSAVLQLTDLHRTNSRGRLF